MKKAIPTILTLFILMIFASCNSAAEKGIITLTTENFTTETEKGVVMVDFWATWCVPCKAMAPVIKEIAGQTKGQLKVGKVDIDANGALANQFSINAIPTIIIFNNGQPVDTLVGMQSKAAIIDALSKFVVLE